MIGRTLNHYQIVSKLGEGGMGEVYVAHDTKLNRRVALKVLPAHLAADAQFRERFQREAKAVAALNHTNIVTIYSVEESATGDGPPLHFLTMELLDGKTLDQLLPESGFSTEQLRGYSKQMCAAIAYAHERGIVHRDLKPQNIVVSASGQLKVLDFGLAKIDAPLIADSSGSSPSNVSNQETEAALTKRGSFMGTIGYMSPEQATGKPTDHRSDLFSLGVILYEMATGKRPFGGDSSAESISSLLRDEPTPVSATRTDGTSLTSEVIGKCLEKEPAERFATATELANALEAAFDGRRSLRSYSAGRRLGSPHAVGVGALALAAVLAIVLSGGLQRGNDSPNELPSAGTTTPATTGTGIGASGRPAIAVMRFDLHGAGESEQWLTSGLAEMLLTGLAQTEGLDVVGTDRLQAAAGQLGAKSLDVLERSRFGEIARHAGAGAMVLGSIFSLGETYRIDVRVEDLASGRVLSADRVSGDEVFPLIDELATRIRTSMSVSGAESTVGSISDVTTTSLEAYRAYVEGVEAKRNLRIADAKGFFRRAIELDPEFAMAHFWLHTIERDANVSAMHLERANALVDRLPDRQRMLLAANRAENDDDTPHAVELLDALLDKYPDEEEAYIYLGTIVLNRGDVPAAIAAFERGVRAIPTSGPIRNRLGYALLEANRYDDAVAQFKEYVRLSPREPNPHDSLAEAYLYAEQPELSAETYARALAIDPTFASAHLGRIRAFSMIGDYESALAELEPLDAVRNGRLVTDDSFISMKAALLARVGRYAEAFQLMETSRARYVENEQWQPAVVSNLVIASFALSLGDHDRATASTARSRERLVDLEPDTAAGIGIIVTAFTSVIEARSNRLDAARAYLAQLDDYDKPVGLVEIWKDVCRGEIALAEGDFEVAEIAFLAVVPKNRRRSNDGGTILFVDWQARIARAKGDLDSEIAAYRALLTRGPHRKWRMRLEPLHVFELARLLDRKGLTSEATAEWQRFRDLWSEADSDLAAVKELHKRLGSK